MSGSVVSNGNPVPPKKGLIDALLLDVLGRQTSLAFGVECGAATLWMLAVLVLRTILAVVVPGGGALAFVPHGFVFAFPTAAYLGDALVGFPLFEDCFPVLPIRIAEAILGRIAPARLLMVVPAQILGSILGTVIFTALVPFAPQEALTAPRYDNSTGIFETWCYDGLVVCAYCIFVISIPELLVVNKISKYWLSVPVALLMLGASIGSGRGLGCTFNPAAVVALSYVQGQVTLKLLLSHLDNTIGSLLGSLVAGIICMKLFPDDATSWRRRE